MSDPRTAERLALRELLAAVESLLDGATDLSNVCGVVSRIRAWLPRDYKRRNAAWQDGGEGGGVFSSTESKENIGVSVSEPMQENQKITPGNISGNIGNGKDWLKPYLSAWTRRYGGYANAGIVARYLKPLHDQHGPEQTLAHWQNYLRGTEVQFVSVSKFATTFGSWTSANPDAWRHDETLARPDESVDAYILRLARAGY